MNWFCAGTGSEEAEVAQHSGILLSGADSCDLIGARAVIQRFGATAGHGIRGAHHRVHDLPELYRLQALDTRLPARRDEEQRLGAEVHDLHSPGGTRPALRLHPRRVRARRPKGSQGGGTSLVLARMPDLDRKCVLPT